MHPGFKNVPCWERFANLNLEMWQTKNPGKNIYKEDALVKKINEEARGLGRPLNAEEVSKIQDEIYK